MHTGQHWDPDALGGVLRRALAGRAGRHLDLRTSDVTAIEAASARDHRGSSARRGARLRGHELHPRRGAGRAAGSRRARRGRAPKRRPRDARRAKQDRGRPVSTYLFAPDERSAQTLRDEGVEGEIHVVGDVMADAAAQFAPLARQRSQILRTLGLEPQRYVLATVHREANVRPDRLRRIVAGLGRSSLPVVLPAHPRTRGVARRERDRTAAADRGDRAARLSRLRGRSPRRPRDRDRLGRAAEGGVLVRRPLRHDAALDGVGRHGRRSARTSSSTTTPTGSPQPSPAARMPAERPALYGDGHASERIATVLSGTMAALCIVTSRSSAPAMSASRSPRSSPTPGAPSSSSTSAPSASRS